MVTQTIAEKIVGAHLEGRNNYTLRNEQHILTEKRAIECQADMAMMLDERDDDAMERRGYSGSGAGSRLIADLNDETTEEISSMTHPLVQALPVSVASTLKTLRQFIASQRQSSIWDGHNHRTAHSGNAEEFLETLRR